MLFTPPAGATREEIGSQQAHATQTTHRCAATYVQEESGVGGGFALMRCECAITLALSLCIVATTKRKSDVASGECHVAHASPALCALSRCSRSLPHAPLLLLHPQPPAHPPIVRSATRRLVRRGIDLLAPRPLRSCIEGSIVIHTACWCHS